MTNEVFEVSDCEIEFRERWPARLWYWWKYQAWRPIRRLRAIRERWRADRAWAAKKLTPGCWVDSLTVTGPDGRRMEMRHVRLDTMTVSFEGGLTGVPCNFSSVPGEDIGMQLGFH